MQAVRQLFAQRALVTLLCAATLLLKLLVPTGYMIGSDHGRLTVELCSGFAAMPAVTDMPAMHGDMPDHRQTKDHGKAEMPCAFSGLSGVALGAIDPIQLAALVAFIMAVGLGAAGLPSIVRPIHLRPPLRGPPTLP